MTEKRRSFFQRPPLRQNRAKPSGGLWDMTSDTDERTVDVHINRIREHLKNNHDFEILTVRGLGYKAVKLKG